MLINKPQLISTLFKSDKSFYIKDQKFSSTVTIKLMTRISMYAIDCIITVSKSNKDTIDRIKLYSDIQFACLICDLLLSNKIEES